MGYIGQLPGRPEELPGRETGTGAPPEPGGPRAGELPDLQRAGTQSVTLTRPATPPEDSSPDAPVTSE
jgi:hypothetical protein